MLFIGVEIKTESVSRCHAVSHKEILQVSWRKESDSYMKEHAREMGMKGVNIKGIQIFEFKMMIHVIHARTKIDLSKCILI